MTGTLQGENYARLYQLKYQLPAPATQPHQPSDLERRCIVAIADYHDNGRDDKLTTLMLRILSDYDLDGGNLDLQDQQENELITKVCCTNLVILLQDLHQFDLHGRFISLLNPSLVSLLPSHIDAALKSWMFYHASFIFVSTGELEMALSCLTNAFQYLSRIDTLNLAAMEHLNSLVELPLTQLTRNVLNNIAVLEMYQGNFSEASKYFSLLPTLPSDKAQSDHASQNRVKFLYLWKNDMTELLKESPPDFQEAIDQLKHLSI